MHAGAPQPEQTVELLKELVALRSSLDSLESQLVATARARGCSWVELGEILGLTPQGASKRHRAARRPGRAWGDGDEPFIHSLEHR